MRIAEHLAADVKRSSEKHKAREKSKSEAKGSRKASRFDVEKADDGSGFMVSTRYGKSDMHYGPPEKSVHKTLSSVHKHMKAACGEEGEEND